MSPILQGRARIVRTIVFCGGLGLLLAASLAPAVGQQGRGGFGAQPPAGPWMNKALPPDQRADMVIEQMTLDEKIQLVHGGPGGFGPPQPGAPPSRSNGGAGWIPGIPRLGIPDLNMADSAVGVTRGAARSRYSTGLPSSVAAAASWDLKLAYLYGAVIGRELRDQGYNMSIGGGVDITREPRNGRNFEYQGEDPILAGLMIGQLMKGVQDQHILGDIKHYALNDQETGRNIGNVILDKRAMRETDLLAFQIGLRDSQAAGVMCSYNKVDGDWACENDYLLNQALKKDFGFRGWVLSDWGGTHSTVKAALAGLDQEMPGNTYFGDALKKAVESGEVPMARLNDMVHRILRSMFAVGVIDNPPVEKVVDVFQGLEDAQRIAEEGSVLLKNANAQLPLSAAAVKSIAVIGSHADVGVLSGGGSAQVDPPGGNAVPPPPPPADSAGRGGRGGGGMFGRGPVYYPSSPLKAIRAKAARAKVEYNAGTDPAAAAALAKASEVAIVFVNQPTSEGRDVATLALPDNQDALVSAVAAANPHTIVILETGGPVTMPWLDRVPAVIEAWYPGISGAQALANILFGDVNPSAKLPVTFAKSDQDLPHPVIAGIDLRPVPTGGSGGRGGRGMLPPFDIPYTEGLKVGYKWFDAQDKQPLFAFGHGLSYTTFAYSGLKAAPASTGATVSFTVRNTGKRAGAEIAQVYASLPQGTGEPPKRLVGWTKVQLAAGQSKSVSVAIEPLFLSIFNVDKDAWQLVPGDYRLMVGGSSVALPLSATVKLGGS
jgi:beta-glucosidase